jgi:MoaA/NifB/PqqE/SkfB family radical SAM enzyme
MKCRFCYYINDVRARNRDKDLTTGECRRLIRHYRRLAMETVEFTGGEPTIRKDIFELADFARREGFKKISVITNGVRLADPDYAARLVDSGINDFLFSLHGSTSRSHDSTTCLPGSFDLLLKAVGNLNKLKAKVRCNSVVTGKTLDDIYARAKLFCDLGVKTVNFIMFNPIEQAASSEEDNFFRYSQAAPRLRSVIDDFAKGFRKLTIRYIPFCLMEGYERHIQNVHQVHYDHDEWDYYLRTRIRQPRWKWLAGVCLGLFILPGKGRWLRWGVDHARHAAILEAHSWLNKHRFDKCLTCSYGFICGGVWKQYACRFGSDELKPKAGPLILEPWYFMDDSQRAE